MYHFVADPHQPELRLSEFHEISSRTAQYLKSFQLEATQYLYDHLIKREFCIFNDESGLGKSATISALISAIAANTQNKTLIVVQNDEHKLVGWEFHFSSLTDLTVCVLQSNEDNTDSPHSVYLAKWSVLRNIDLSKLNFDYVIVDHRGLTLNNHFCSSMLIKHFEKRVDIVISSVDVTSDLKLLQNILLLGGRLEQKYKNFRRFEQNFRLPNIKEVLSTKVELEDYFRHREILSEYIKDYRLRRYRHQFKQYLPLVTPEEYKTNLSIWIASHNGNNILSGSVNDNSTIDLRSTADSEEILECLLRMKHERQVTEHIANIRDTVEIRELSDDSVAMSPLIFESSESDIEVSDLIQEQLKNNKTMLTANKEVVTLISSDELEIVTSEKKKAKQSQQQKEIVTRNKKSEISKANKAKNEKSKNEVLEKSLNCRPCRVPKVQTAQISKTHERVKNVRENSMKNCSLTTRKYHCRETKILPQGAHNRRTRAMDRLTRSSDRKKCKYMSTDLALVIDKKNVRPRNRKESKVKKTTSVVVEATVVPIKLKKNQISAETATDSHTSTKINPQGSKVVCIIDSPDMPPSTEYEEIQCGQRLPSDLKQSSDSDRSEMFRLPTTSMSGNQMDLVLPAMGSMLTELDFTFLPNTNPTEVVLFSSSTDESSAMMMNQSRRTRALKCRRNQPRNVTQTIPNANISNTITPSFRELLARQSSIHKSPDLFSVSSDITTILPSQQNAVQSISTDTSSPFEGFKIFGSEVKHFQQQNAKIQEQQKQKGFKNAGVLRKKRDRSCLDILEKMFEPCSNNTGLALALEKTTNTKAVLPAYPPDFSSANTRQQQNSQCLTVDDNDVFEITSNGEFGGTLHFNSNGEVSPVQQQRPSTRGNNKITNYLIGNNNSGSTQNEVIQVDEMHSTRNNRTQIPTQKKSQKSTQLTKLTRWFVASSASTNGGSTSIPITGDAASKSASIESVGLLRHRRRTKRSGLELFE